MYIDKREEIMVEKYDENQIYEITGIPQTSYGFLKRLIFIYSFISQNINEEKTYTVLDIGCGTGEYLTIPLGSLIKNIEILGIDNDRKSIEYARTKNTFQNVKFECTFIEKLEKNLKYDFIILSEVLEHLNDPDSMLIEIRELLSPEGICLITIPNGFGPFEIESKISKFLKEKNIIAYFKKQKKILNFAGKGMNYFKRFKNRPKNDLKGRSLGNASLCEDQHVQFFSYNYFYKLCLKHNFEIKYSTNRTFFAGAFSSRIIDKSNTLINYNAKISDYIPPFMASGWMFLLKKHDDQSS